MDHRPLAPAAPATNTSTLRVEPLDSFGRFSEYLSPAALRLVQTPGTSTVIEQYRAAPDQPWQDWSMPTKPSELRPRMPRAERRVLLSVYLGITVTGPIQPHHLRHFAGRLNQAVARGLLIRGALVPPCAMQLAYGRVPVGPSTYEDMPLRYALIVYAYAAPGAMEHLQALDWSFPEGGLPMAFPEERYPASTRAEDVATVVPAGYWRGVAINALFWAAWASLYVWAGFNALRGSFE